VIHRWQLGVPPSRALGARSSATPVTAPDCRQTTSATASPPTASAPTTDASRESAPTAAPASEPRSCRPPRRLLPVHRPRRTRRHPPAHEISPSSTGQSRPRRLPPHGQPSRPEAPGQPPQLTPAQTTLARRIGFRLHRLRSPGKATMGDSAVYSRRPRSSGNARAQKVSQKLGAWLRA
jgi:hypothetical protein